MTHPYNFKTVRLVISQPRIENHPKEWTLPVANLLKFGDEVKVAGAKALLLTAPGNEAVVEACLNPSEDACRFCLASATCPALRVEVAATVALGARNTDDVTFDDLTVAEPAAGTDAALLGASMSKVGLIEAWCKAVRAEVEKRLLAGQPVAGYKLVQGRRGARQWLDQEEVKALLVKARCKTEEMFNLKLISPTEAEKRMAVWLDADGMEHQPILGPRQWNKVKALVTQSEGSPSVAPESDKRPALSVGAHDDDFADESASDLL